MQLIRKGEKDVFTINGTHNSACDEYVIQADKFSTPIDRAYNNKVKQMVKHTKARVVEKQLFEEQWEKNIDPDVHNIKSKSAIKSMRFREAHGGKSELGVLREFYNKRFVRLYKLIPSILLVTIHKELMDIAQTLLTQNRGIGFIDGTFSVCREREQLTTLMMLYTKGVHSIAIPFAFCIGPKGSKTYDVFLTEVVAASDGAFQPRAILGDFEIAFRNSCTTVLHCQYFGDLFHFLQANQRWLRSNKYGDIAAEITIDLRSLFYQKTQVTFLRELDQFQSKWDNRCKPYITYFNMQWLNTIQHDLWASYPRAALNIPTGDQAMESFNHTFKSIAKTDVRQRLDTLVSELFVYCEYWKDIIGNDELFERTIIDLTNKRKATTSSPGLSLLLLSSSSSSSSSSSPSSSSSSPSSSASSSSSPSPMASPSSSSPSPSSQSSLSPSDSQSSSSSSSSTPPQSSLLLLSSSSSSSLSSSSSSSLSSSSSSSVSLFADNGPSELLLKHYYCVRCLTAKKNDMCSLQMCLTCCSWESSKCRLAKHNEAKGNNQENPHMTTLHEAITHYSNGNGISVQLRYGGGSKPGEWRAVVPVQWENTRRKSFRAIDSQDGITKHYILSFVTGVKL